MPDIKTKTNLGNFSDIKDDIIIKEDDEFQVFSHGNLSDLELEKSSQEKINKKASTSLLDTGKEELQLDPPPPMVWNKKSAFYFDLDDEDDIEKERKKIAQTEPVEAKKYSLNKIVEKISNNYNLNLAPQLENRFKNVILSFLKHTRTKIDVLNFFQDPIDNSGLNLSPDISKKLIDLLINIQEKIDQVRGVIVNDIKEKKEVSKNVGQAENLANKDPRQTIEIEKKDSYIPTMQRRYIFNNENKPKILDVRKKDQVIGPVEELLEITLNTFRKISKNPLEAIQKIIDKIDALEKDSYLKKAEAINNWRQSEIYQIYLSMGRESMENDISIDKIVEKRALSKDKVLSKEEFSAITDLNKKLRF